MAPGEQDVLFKKEKQDGAFWQSSPCHLSIALVERKEEEEASFSTHFQ